MASRPQKIGYLLARVRHIAQDEGFAVNENKTRVLRQSTRQLVTGVVVNDRPGVAAPTRPPASRDPAPREIRRAWRRRTARSSRISRRGWAA